MSLYKITYDFKLGHLAMNYTPNEQIFLTNDTKEIF